MKRTPKNHLAFFSSALLCIVSGCHTGGSSRFSDAQLMLGEEALAYTPPAAAAPLTRHEDAEMDQSLQLIAGKARGEKWLVDGRRASNGRLFLSRSGSHGPIKLALLAHKTNGPLRIEHALHSNGADTEQAEAMRRRLMSQF